MKHLYNKRGSSSIMLLLMVVAIVGLMALTVDAGLMYIEKSKLQNTVDAAVLAAVSAYERGPEKMREEAGKYAVLNGVEADSLLIDIREDNRRATITADKTVPLYFAKILSIFDADVEAKASAAAGPIASTKGVRPLGIEDQEFIYGQTYTLKQGGGGGTSGNYGALSLGGTGSSNYRYNLKNGYNALSVKVGDYIETETGNMDGATFDGIDELLSADLTEHPLDLSKLEKSCPRLIKIPVIDSFNVEGRSTVKVVGFAAFFLDDVVKVNGKTEITGRFVKAVSEGEIDETGTGFGLFGTKLVE